TSNSYATGNVSYTGASGFYIGGLVGAGQNGSVAGTGSTYSYATGTVTVNYSGTSTGYVGGLVGSFNGQPNLTTETEAAGSISVTNAVSGSASNTLIIGGLLGNTGSSITNSYSSDNVTYIYQGTSSGTSTVYVGGLVGQPGTGGTTGSVTGSYANGAVTAQYSSNGCSGSACTGNVTSYVGGLIGLNGNNNASTVTTSFATGSVSSSLLGGTEYIGGLVGYNYSTSASAITNAYATSSVVYTGTTTSAKTAGLVGYNQAAATISDTYATGYVSASHGTAGGLVALNAGTVSASYLDTRTTGQNTALTGATGVSTATLQNSGSNGGLPSGWSSSTWGIVQGVSYPYLSWQVASGTPQVIFGIAYSNRGTTALAG